MPGAPHESAHSEPAVSLVFPAYNPGRALDHTLPALRRFLATVGRGWEVLFVCDGCTDGTPVRLTEWAQSLSGVRVLDYVQNRGKGHAVRLGLAAARGRFRLFADVDLAYDFDDIQRLASTLREGADVAIASRRHPDSRLELAPGLEGYAYRRHLQSLLFGRLARRLLGLPHLDTQAGLKGLTARATRLLLPELACDGFAFDCELLAACGRHGLTVAEVPVRVRYVDRESTMTVRAALRVVRELWRVRRVGRAVPSPELPATEQLRVA